MAATHKVDSVRQLMGVNSNNNDNIDAYVIYSGDAHESETPTLHDERRKFITDFTGSAGEAIITKDQALLWVDGRYHSQAEKQVDRKYWTIMKSGLTGVPKLQAWINNNETIKRIGLDGSTTSLEEYNRIKKTKRCMNGSLVIKCIEESLIDKVWENQPLLPMDNIYIHPYTYSGEHFHQKQDRVHKEIIENNCSHLVLTNLDEICWYMNLRGNDMEFSPTFLAYVLINREKSTLYIDEKKIDKKTKEYLDENKITIKSYNQISTDLNILSKNEFSKNDFRVWFSPSVNLSLYNSLQNPDSAFIQVSPVEVFKGVKNESELSGMREAHIVDGLAECKFLYKVDTMIKSKSIFDHDEITMHHLLDSCRAHQTGFKGLSFPTISSIGPNGAIIHYRPCKETAAKMTQSIYLVDSGGQYVNGTTDTTRTIHLGEPNEKEKKCYTCVLKGFLNLSSSFFPCGTTGVQLDTLARQSLWSQGLDYRHGTGHGVGAFLNVHEGPISISPALSAESPKRGIIKGTIVSIEPGYYEDGHFGIRIENLVEVVSADLKDSFGDKEFLRFRHLTMIPISKKLIDFKLLSTDDVKNLNDYHETVYNTLKPRLEVIESDENMEILAWLKVATEPIKL